MALKPNTPILQPDHPNNRGLVCALLMNEGAGSIFHDASGKVNNGIWTSAVSSTWAGSKEGIGVKVGAANSYINVQDSPSLTSTAITVEILVIPTATQVAYDALINKQFSVGEPYNCWIIDAGSDGNTWGFSISQNAGGGPDSGQWRISAGAIVEGQLTHLTGTYDGATQNFYKDGRLIGSTNIALTLANSSNPVRIGSWEGVSSFFDGNVIRVRLFNVAKSAFEVYQLYQSDYSEFRPQRVPLIWVSGPAPPARLLHVVSTNMRW